MLYDGDMYLLDVVDLTAVKYARFAAVLVERNRDREFTLSRLGLANHADVHWVLFVDREQREGVRTRLARMIELWTIRCYRQIS